MIEANKKVNRIFCRLVGDCYDYSVANGSVGPGELRSFSEDHVKNLTKAKDEIKDLIRTEVASALESVKINSITQLQPFEWRWRGDEAERTAMSQAAFELIDQFNERIDTVLEQYAEKENQ